MKLIPASAEASERELYRSNLEILLEVLKVSSDRTLRLTEEEWKEKPREKDLARWIKRGWDRLFPGLELLGNETSISQRLGRYRVDTLARRDHGPVVVEYKAVRGGRPISQGLSYMQLIKKEKVFENRTPRPVDWSRPLLICIAPDFSSVGQQDVDAITDCEVELHRYELVPASRSLRISRFTPQHERGTPCRERISLQFREALRQHPQLTDVYTYGSNYWRCPAAPKGSMFWVFCSQKGNKRVYLELGRSLPRGTSQLLESTEHEGMGPGRIRGFARLGTSGR